MEQNIPAPSTPSSWKKSRGVAIALALFVGHFGIQWFYLERPKRGLLYALFFWTFIPTICALVEVFSWAFMDLHAWHQRYESVFTPPQAK
jgi:TM2 domain-containing membrane protein YozV